MNIGEMQQLQMSGLSLEELRKLSMYRKGQGINTIVGTQTQNIQIPGVAKALLGFSAIATTEDFNTTMQFTIKLDNDTILDHVDLGFVSPDDRALQPNGYCELFRVMEGKSTMELAITATVATFIQVCFHYVGVVSQNWRNT